MICRSCNKVRANRPRGLCYCCYYNPEVRNLFPSTSKFAKKGAGVDVTTSVLSLEPTRAIPGTEEKIRILMERATNGLCLWHPMDASKSPQHPEILGSNHLELAGVA